MLDTIYAGFWGDSYGTTTGGKVSVYAADAAGELALLQTIETGSAISAVYKNPYTQCVYAIGEVREGLACGIGGDIFVLAPAPDGLLYKRAIFSSTGAFPLDIVFFPHMVAVVNHGSTSFKVLQTHPNADGGRTMQFAYDEASLVLFAVDDNDALRFVDIHIFEGSGLIPFFQDSASPHSVCRSAKGNLLAVPLRGTDQVEIFRMDDIAGKLVQVLTISLPQGCGPRNAVFHPTMPVIYIMNEIKATLEIFQYSVAEQKSTHLGTVTTVEDGQMPDRDYRSLKAPHPVAITIDQSGRFIYVLTRATNTLTTYRVLTQGMLEKVDTCSTLGVHPRTVVQSDDGAWLYLSNLETQTIVRYNINKETGIPCDAAVVAEHLGKISCLGR